MRKINSSNYSRRSIYYIHPETKEETKINSPEELENLRKSGVITEIIIKTVTEPRDISEYDQHTLDSMI